MRFGSDIHKESLITPVVKVRGGDWWVLVRANALFPGLYVCEGFHKMEVLLYTCRPLSWDFIAMFSYQRSYQECLSASFKPVSPKL